MSLVVRLRGQQMLEQLSHRSCAKSSDANWAQHVALEPTSRDKGEPRLP